MNSKNSPKKVVDELVQLLARKRDSLSISDVQLIEDSIRLLKKIQNDMNRKFIIENLVIGIIDNLIRLFITNGIDELFR